LRPPSLHLFLDADNAHGVDAYLADLAAVASDGIAGRLKRSDTRVVYST